MLQSCNRDHVAIVTIVAILQSTQVLKSSCNRRNVAMLQLCKFYCLVVGRGPPRRKRKKLTNVRDVRRCVDCRRNACLCVILFVHVVGVFVCVCVRVSVRCLLFFSLFDFCSVLMMCFVFLCAFYFCGGFCDLLLMIVFVFGVACLLLTCRVSGVVDVVVDVVVVVVVVVVIWARGWGRGRASTCIE